MRKSLLVASLAIVPLVVWATIALRPTTTLCEPILTAPETRAPASVRVREATTAAFRFRRELSVQSGRRNALEIALGGSFWIQPHEGAFRLLLKIESAPELPRNPWARVDFTLPRQIQRVSLAGPYPLDPRERREEEGQVVRTALDLLDQLLFFADTDTAGHYRAEISPLSEGKYRKRKLAYVDGPYARSRILRSEHHLWVSGETRALARILLSEGREEVALDQTGLTFRSRYRIVRSEGSPRWDEPDSWQEVALAEFDVPSGAPGAVPGAAPAVAQVTDLTGVPPTPWILDRLRDRPAREAQLLFRPLVKRLDAQPGVTTPLVAAQLEGFKNDPRKLALLIGALASSRRPEPQRLLTLLFNEPTLPSPTRQVILRAWIGARSTLPPETTEVLKTVATDPARPPEERRGALLALGAEAGRQPAGSAPHRDLEAHLAANAAQAESVRATLDALDALGNTQSAHSLDWIEAQLVHSSEAVRAHAYLALRLVPGARAQSLLEKGALDASARVRQAVATALQIRSEL